MNFEAKPIHWRPELDQNLQFLGGGALGARSTIEVPLDENRVSNDPRRGSEP